MCNVVLCYMMLWCAMSNCMVWWYHFERHFVVCYVKLYEMLYGSIVLRCVMSNCMRCVRYVVHYVKLYVMLYGGIVLW